MDKIVLDFTVEKAKELIDAPSCSHEAKTAAKSWLDAVGTADETAEAKRFLDELEANIMPVDALLGFAESDTGAQTFGADLAKNIAAHAKDIKSAGAIYCDCPACAAAAAILDKKDSLLS